VASFGSGGFGNYGDSAVARFRCKTEKTPMLWFGAENDAVKNLKGARSSNAYYGANFCYIKEVGHNLMMEQSYRDTALKVSK
jgi:hypothetical protein